jgi:hypothetical protein
VIAVAVAKVPYRNYLIEATLICYFQFPISWVLILHLNFNLLFSKFYSSIGNLYIEIGIAMYIFFSWFVLGNSLVSLLLLSPHPIGKYQQIFECISATTNNCQIERTGLYHLFDAYEIIQILLFYTMQSITFSIDSC